MALPAAAQGAGSWGTLIGELQKALRSADRGEASRAAGELVLLLELLDEELESSQAISLEAAQAIAHAAQVFSRLPAEQRADDAEARRWLERALVAAERTGDHGLQAYAALWLADFLRERGDLDGAEILLRFVVEECPRDRGSRPQAHVLLAQIARARGIFDVAAQELAAAEQALAAAGAAWPGRTAVQADLCSMRATLDVAIGNPDQALLAIRELRSLAEGTGRADLQARAALQAAYVAFALGRAEALEREVRAGLEAVRRAHVPGLAARLQVLRALLRASRESGEEVEAELVRLLRADGVVAVDRLWLEAARVELCLREKRFEEAADLLRDLESTQVELLESGELLERGMVLSALRVGLVLGSGASREEVNRLERTVSDDFTRFLEEWRSAPRPEGGAGFLSYAARRRFLGELLRLTFAAGPASDSFDTALAWLERCQALGTFALRAGYTVRGPRAVRRAFTGKRRGVVLLVPGPDGSHLLAFDEVRQVHVTLPSERLLEPLRSDFVAACSEGAAAGRDGFLRDSRARRLAEELLLPPVRELLAGWDELTVVGTSLSGYLPFEFLPWSDGAWLGDRLAIAYLPSFPVGFLLRERGAGREASEGSLQQVLLAAPVVDARTKERWPSVGDLSFTSREQALLLGAYEKDEVRVFAGPEATPHALAEHGGAAQVLQVLAHGVLDFERVRPAGLALAAQEGERSQDPDADRGVVWCADVERLVMPALSIVWACNAGQGPWRRGEDGVSSLADAFLAAGSDAVVISSQRLEYEAVLRLARQFHLRLTDGASPARALQAARRELVRGDPRRAHPAWSLVHVTGLGHQPVFPTSGSEPGTDLRRTGAGR